MENWQRAGFGNEYIFRVCRSENAMALLDAALAGLREAGFPKAAKAVRTAMLEVTEAARLAKTMAREAGYPLNEGWPEGGEKIL